MSTLVSPSHSRFAAIAALVAGAVFQGSPSMGATLAWRTNGIRVPGPTANPFLLRPDGAGGLLAFGPGLRCDGASVSAGRLDAEGHFPTGWHNGQTLACANRYDWRVGTSDIFANPDGSMITTYRLIPYLSGSSGIPSITKADRDGELIWVPSAVIHSGGAYLGIAILAPDGAGGAYCASVEDVGGPRTALLQHFSTTGHRSWGSGLRLGSSAGIRLTADGVGGAIVSWFDFEDSLRIQRFDAVANPLWGGRGVVLPLAFGAVVSDGTGGAWIVLQEADGITRVRRVDDEGRTVAGWPGAGLPILHKSHSYGFVDAIADSTGGILVMQFERNPDSLFVSRVGPKGVVPGWDPGVLVSTQYFGRIAPDGGGGAYVVWAESRDDATGADVYAQHYLDNGARDPLWSATGDPVCRAQGMQFGAEVISDGKGGAYVAWRGGGDEGSGVYAQRILGDASTSTTTSLVEARAESQGIRLRWWVSDSRVEATLLRSSGSGWILRVDLTADPQGFLEFLDTDVTPGGRYGYRLESKNDHPSLSEEVWITVEHGSPLGLRILSNPARGRLEMSLALPHSGSGHLEVFDPAGRLVWRTDLAQRPGPQIITTPPGVHLLPGIYHVRLKQQGSSATARAVVVE